MPLLASCRGAWDRLCKHGAPQEDTDIGTLNVRHVPRVNTRRRLRIAARLSARRESILLRKGTWVYALIVPPEDIIRRGRHRAHHAPGATSRAMDHRAAGPYTSGISVAARREPR